MSNDSIPSFSHIYGEGGIVSFETAKNHDNVKQIKSMFDKVAEPIEKEVQKKRKNQIKEMIKGTFT